MTILGKNRLNFLVEATDDARQGQPYVVSTSDRRWVTSSGGLTDSVDLLNVPSAKQYFLAHKFVRYEDAVLVHRLISRDRNIEEILT
jgi:hypothetical protein